LVKAAVFANTNNFSRLKKNGIIDIPFAAESLAYLLL
jgi:hypothetical protein